MASVLRSLRTPGMVFQKGWFKAFSGGLFRKRKVRVESVSGILGSSSMQALEMLLGEKSAQVLKHGIGDFDLLVSGRAYKLSVFSAGGKKVFKLWDLTNAVALFPGREKEILSLVTATIYVTDLSGRVLGISSQWDRTAKEYEEKEIAEGGNRKALYSSDLIGRNFSEMLVGRKSKLFFSGILKLINVFGKLSKEFWAENICQSECRIAQMLHTLYTKTKVSANGSKLFFHDTLNLTAITDLQAKLLQAERIDFGRAYRQTLKSVKKEWQLASQGIEPAINPSSTFQGQFIQSWLLHGLRGTADIESIQAFVSRHILKALLSSENAKNKLYETKFSAPERKKRKLKKPGHQADSVPISALSPLPKGANTRLEILSTSSTGSESEPAASRSSCPEQPTNLNESFSQPTTAALVLIDSSVCEPEPSLLLIHSEQFSHQNSITRKCALAEACFECAISANDGTGELEMPRTTNTCTVHAQELPLLLTEPKSQYLHSALRTAMHSAEKNKSDYALASFDCVSVGALKSKQIHHLRYYYSVPECISLPEFKEPVFMVQQPVEPQSFSFSMASKKNSSKNNVLLQAELPKPTEHEICNCQYGQQLANAHSIIQETVLPVMQQAKKGVPTLEIAINQEKAQASVVLKKSREKPNPSLASQISASLLGSIVSILSIKSQS